MIKRPEYRLTGSIFLNRLPALSVQFIFSQFLVGEHNHKRLEGLVLICKVKKNQLFKSLGAVCTFNACTRIKLCGGKIISRRNLFLINRNRWKLADKIQQQFVNLSAAKLLVQRSQQVVHKSQHLVASVKHTHIMKNLINQPHCVELAGRQFLILLATALKHIINQKLKGAHIPHICKNHVSARSKKPAVKITKVSYFLRNMKFVV